jgi:hypothetical protein
MKKLIAIMIATAAAVGIAAAQTVTLQVSPDKLATAGTVLTSPNSQTFYVGSYSTNAYTSQYTVAVTTGTNWMSVDVSSGSSTGEWDTVTVTYVSTGLTAGIYEGVITVAKTNALGGAQTKTVAVTLTVNDDVNLGVAYGPSSIATDPSGLAIGDRNKRAVAIGSNTVQIGGGVNSSAGTAKIKAYEILTSGGLIPAARLAGVAMDASAATGVRASILTGLYQADTNATTDSAKYTPAFIGQILTGKDGGTNTAYIAVGLTTSSWVKTFTP